MDGRATTSIVTGLYAHRHGFLHWDAEFDPAAETMFREFAEHGYDVASFVFDTQFLFTHLPEANVRGTSETLDGVVGWRRPGGPHLGESRITLVFGASGTRV